MNPFLLITAFLSMFPGINEKPFEGLIVYEYKIGPGADSLRTITFLEELGPKVFYYTGKGNVFRMLGKDTSSGLGLLYLEQDKKAYWISPGNDFIPYYHTDFKKKNDGEYTLMDSTGYVLGYECSIIRYNDGSDETLFYYVNDSILLKSDLSYNPGMKPFDRMARVCPLRIVTVKPGSAILTLTAIEIKPMVTDSLFENYSNMVYSGGYELLRIDSLK